MKVGVWASVALLAGFTLVGASCLQILGGDDRLGTAGSGGTSGSSSSPTTGALCNVDAVKDLGKSAEECLEDENAAPGSFTTRCHDGDVVVGAFVYWAAYLDRFGVLCAPIEDGVPNRCAAYPACWAGKNNKNDTTYDDEMCLPGQAVVRLDYSYGACNGDGCTEYDSHVDKLILHCKKPSSWMNNSPYDFTSPSFGGFVNEPFNPLPCPLGQVATGFTGRRSLWVNDLTDKLCWPPPSESSGQGGAK